MKFVAIINGKKKDPAERVVSFFTDDEPPAPVEPPEPDEPKDGGVVKDKPGTLNSDKPS
jgi:hypothetical protein